MGSRAGEARAAHTKTGRKDGDGRVIYRASGGGEVVRRMVSSGAKKGTMAWRKPTPGGSQRGGHGFGGMYQVYSVKFRHPDGRVMFMYSSDSLMRDQKYVDQYETSWIWHIPSSLPRRPTIGFQISTAEETGADHIIGLVIPGWQGRTLGFRQELLHVPGRVVPSCALRRELWPEPEPVVYNDAPTQPPQPPP